MDSSAAGHGTQDRNLKSSRREATVYDAVAGRVAEYGFIKNTPSYSATKDTNTKSTLAAPPESVLFRRKDAPVRYEESDLYFANEDLPPHALPDSDLLKALHVYAADFYSRNFPNGSQIDGQSMDETALLAFGILMEESCREVLGESGDLVLTEGLPPNGSSERPLVQTIPRSKTVITPNQAAIKSGATRRAKRCKVDV